MNPFIQFVKDLSDRLGSGFSSLNQNDPGKVAYVRNLEREMKSRDVMDIPLDELPVVVFDLETTGFYPYNGDTILSVGAVKVQGGEVLTDETFYSLVHHEEGLSDEIAELTGLTDEQLEEAPPLRDVLKQFYAFVKEDVLVAHHAHHEKQFMSHSTWTALRKSFQHRIVDSALLPKLAQHDIELNSLDQCCDYYGIAVEQRHHALYDAMATAELWVEGIRELREKGLVDLKDMYTQLALMEG
ncbi:3'-5' exoribonuclease [Halobacillus litoralis]|uniref:exonuclease domain-containing protein n=1 Tax=Halobacillus litoralis TaxID=45668 RepID=UPI001CD5E843|nr:exonuclease domain-containing protein [Halobacillus litoralis]MCA0972500.1 3'-5' exoribonuclease [Halobacillus litoralis]